MFKKYILKDEDRNLLFFVHSKKTRNGFCHEACCIGLPRQSKETEELVNVEDLFKRRYAKVNYLNRTWESWPGQTVLTRLWEKLEELKEKYPFFGSGNPFAGDEPVHEDLPEPDELFDRFKVR